MSNKNSQDSGVLGGFISAEHFENVVSGVYGTFNTPSGKVSYLQTKAKLQQDGSSHSKLTKSIVPAREALNISEMNFNQLLQRDLDDHRIATKLIDYIINPPVDSLPGLFPPILTILLPFDSSQRPVESFPIPKISKETDNEFRSEWNFETYGKAFRSQVALQDDGSMHPLSIAILRWNSSEAKLVIMDGQHRAMALLAIHRTLTNSWNESAKGARYKPFYEHHIKKSMEKVDRDGKNLAEIISNIELPVTVCWFPETTASRINPHRAARKLFVDVNNTAKPPSESRLTLLSDTSLTSIFARELLNRLRADGSVWLNSFPLYAIEYDNPEKDSSSPRRWSAVTSLDILKETVIRSVFGPPRLIDEANPSQSGPPPVRDMDARMRNQLKIHDIFPPKFNDGDRVIDCDAISEKTFPLEDQVEQKKLLDSFFEMIGSGILTLLSSVEPYKCHINALIDRYNNWFPADNNSTLAKDALFDGVGMLWTIKEGHEFWVSECLSAREAHKPLPTRSDISAAWIILEDDQKPLFLKCRSQLYFGSESQADLNDSESLYKSLVTYAAQVGLILAWSSLYSKACKDDIAPADLSGPFSEAINATLNSSRIRSQSRRRILLRQSSVEGFKPLNEIPRLQPQFSVYYRYLWLELALASPGREILQTAGVDLTAADLFLTECRKTYLSFLISIRTKHYLQERDILDIGNPALRKETAHLRAKEDVSESQAQARKYWFGDSLDDARKFINEHLHSTMPSEVQPDATSSDPENSLDLEEEEI